MYRKISLETVCIPMISQNVTKEDLQNIKNESINPDTT